MSEEQTFTKLVGLVKSDIKKFEVVDKESSTFMKRLNFFVRIFNKDFMTKYSTTVYPKVYFPTGMNPYTKWTILAHEWIHLRGGKKSQIAFMLRYFFPQWLVVFSLLAFLAIWFSKLWLLALLAILFAAPLPAIGRMKEELDGYTMSMAVFYWRTGYIRDSYKTWLATQFTSSAYYFMWPFKRSIMRKLHSRANKIKLGEYDNVYPFNEVKSLIESTKYH